MMMSRHDVCVRRMEHSPLQGALACVSHACRLGQVHAYSSHTHRIRAD